MELSFPTYKASSIAFINALFASNENEPSKVFVFFILYTVDTKKKGEII